MKAKIFRLYGLRFRRSMQGHTFAYHHVNKKGDKIYATFFEKDGPQGYLAYARAKSASVHDPIDQVGVPNG